MLFKLPAVYLAGLACIVLCFRLWLKLTTPKKVEPPMVHASIPWIGDLISIYRHKSNHFKHIRDKCGLPMVRLDLPVRVYAVFSVPIIQSIQKRTKNFAFEPIQAMFSVKLCGVSSEARRILHEDMDESTGEFGSIYTSMHKGLNPGHGLNELNRSMADRVCEFVNALQPKHGESTTVRLDEWLRHCVTLATTDAVYGPHNPFRNSRVEGAFWEFEREIPKLLFLPDWLARHGARNRQVVADAFQHYYGNNHHEDASGLVKDFYATEIAYGFSMADRCLFEVGHAIATLANTSGAVFWMIFSVFSDPEALRDIRREVSAVINTTDDGSETGKQHQVDMTKVNSQCPTLVSVFRETLRVHSAGISLRKVLKKTLLSATYNLDKGDIILMPTMAIHTDTQVWGPDALSFNYRRFRPDNPRKSHPAAFRSFGGGTTLCPGRHFATAQIMAWAIVFIMRFEAEPTAASGGQWRQPTTKHSNASNVIMRPDEDVEVNLSLNKEYGDGKWAIRLTGDESMLGVLGEDPNEEELHDSKA